jgi:hypothetical protein
MPHMFVNRRRVFDLTKNRKDLKAQFRWEVINAVIYEAGGLVFIVGSLYFFPALEKFADIGAWIFFFGSLLYLVVTLHDLAEVRRHWKESNRHGRGEILEYIAASSCVWGTILLTGESTFRSWQRLRLPR